jgi:hypothetical protein
MNLLANFFKMSAIDCGEACYIEISSIELKQLRAQHGSCSSGNDRLNTYGCDCEQNQRPFNLNIR